MMRITVIPLLLLSFVTANGFGQKPYEYAVPVALADGWKTNDFRSRPIDTTKIYRLFGQLQQGEHKLHSILLAKNSEIVIEEYFDGNTVDKQHDLRSATKSITSILLGIAIDKGFIASIDDPISKYIKGPVYTLALDGGKDKITIRHLVTMSSGLDCNDWDKGSKGQEDKVYRKQNWIQYFLDLPLGNEPGTVSNYCTMGQVLSAEIISLASGITLDKFADKYLFGPMGITNMSWGHTSKREVIPSAKRAYMTTRDMAKIGLLVLHKGKWNDQQLVSEHWIAEATAGHTKITGLDYGYLWWNIPFRVNDKIVLSKAALGNGGQYILIFPEVDMVAVFTGGAYNSEQDKLPFAIMTDVFLPAFIAEK